MRHLLNLNIPLIFHNQITAVALYHYDAINIDIAKRIKFKNVMNINTGTSVTTNKT